VGKTFKAIQALLPHLQCILQALAASVESFLSAMITYVIVLYIFGLIFMSGVKAYLKQNAQDPEVVRDLQELYGTIDASMWTLVAAISGGYDWMDVARPLIKVGLLYKLYFLIYILFVTVGLLNILTGIFVNCAMQSSAMNREIAIEDAIYKGDCVVKEVVDLFLEADEDNSGTLSWAEFEIFIKDRRIKAFFMALELDMSSAGNIFNLLDESGDGMLDANEFVQGCIAYRGYARKVDLTIMMRDFALIFQKIDNMERVLVPQADLNDEAEDEESSPTEDDEHVTQ
jgi:hypothetical protein